MKGVTLSSDLELRMKIINSIVDNKLSHVLGLSSPQAKERKNSKTLLIHVFRNITVEPIIALSQPLEYLMGLTIDWNLKPFNSLFISEDDLESFSSKKSEIIMWFDTNKPNENSLELLDEIHHSCKMVFVKTGRKPIVLLNGPIHVSLKKKFEQFSVAIVLPQDHDSNLNDKYKEEQGLSIFLSPKLYSRYIIQLVWRTLGQRICQQIKAIFVDLDGTLYDGILSEDGIDGINFNEYSKRLIDLLLEALASGIFVFIVTKNRPETIELLKSRAEIAELLNKCNGIIASFERKSSSLNAILKRIRQNENSCLFLDDNPAELFDVMLNFSSMNIMHSSFDARRIQVLRDYLTWGRSSHWTSEANLRSQDLESNEQRNMVIEKQGFFEYARRFKMKSSVSVNQDEQKDRIVELSQRANQFNLSQKRFDLEELNHFLKSGGSFATASIRDILADSGIVLTMVFKIRQESNNLSILHIEDLCISCRALGRGIETSLIVQTLKIIQEEIGLFDGLSCEFNMTSANMPAQIWIKQIQLGELNSKIVFLDFVKMQEISREMRGIIF